MKPIPSYQLSIRIPLHIITYYKRLASKIGMRYQTLIKMTLQDAVNRRVSVIPHWRAVQSHAESSAPLIIDESIVVKPKVKPTILPDKPKPTVRDAARLMSAELRALSTLPDDDE